MVFKKIFRRLLKILRNGDHDTNLIFPPPNLCTDNGVMVAWAGIEKLNQGISDSIEDQIAHARWPLGIRLEELERKT